MLNPHDFDPGAQVLLDRKSTISLDPALGFQGPKHFRIPFSENALQDDGVDRYPAVLEILPRGILGLTSALAAFAPGAVPSEGLLPALGGKRLQIAEEDEFGVWSVHLVDGLTPSWGKKKPR